MPVNIEELRAELQARRGGGKLKQGGTVAGDDGDGGDNVVAAALNAPSTDILLPVPTVEADVPPAAADPAVPPVALPCACASAGASFTPSPAIATTAPAA